MRKAGSPFGRRASSRALRLRPACLRLATVAVIPCGPLACHPTPPSGIGAHGGHLRPPTTRGRGFRLPLWLAGAALAVLLAWLARGRSGGPAAGSPGSRGRSGFRRARSTRGGRLLLVVDQGSGTLAVYHVDAAAGTLTLKSTPGYDLGPDGRRLQRPGTPTRGAAEHAPAARSACSDAVSAERSRLRGGYACAGLCRPCRPWRLPVEC